MATVIIHQNPHLVKVGGFEKLNRNLYSGSIVNFGIATKNKKLNLALNNEERKTIENHYGVSLDTNVGVEYYTSGDFNFKIYDKIMSWNLDDAETLLKYGAAIANGILAPDKKAVESPRCEAIFYVYNAEAESSYTSELNELKIEVMYRLGTIRKENANNIITLAKYHFDSFTKFTASSAFNKFMDYAEKHTKINNNLKTLDKILDEDFTSIELTVLIQEAINKGLIIKNKQQEYINRESMTEYGKSIPEIKYYLVKNPEDLGEGKATDKVYALRRLLKE